MNWLQLDFRTIDRRYELWAARRYLGAPNSTRALMRRIKLYERLARQMKLGRTPLSAFEALWQEAADYNEKTKIAKTPRAHMAVILDIWRKRQEAGHDQASIAAAMRGWIPDFEAAVINAGRGTRQVQTILNLAILLRSTMEIREEMKRALMQPKFVMGILVIVLFMIVYFVMPFLFRLIPIGNLHGLAYPVALLFQLLRHIIFVPLILLGGIWAAIRWSLPNWVGRWRLKAERFPPWSGYKFEQSLGFLIALAALLPNMPETDAVTHLAADPPSPYMRERLRTFLDIMKKGSGRGSALGLAMKESGLNFPSREVITDIIFSSQDKKIGDAIAELVQDEIAAGVRNAKTISISYNNFALALVGLAMLILFGSIAIIMADIVINGMAGPAGAAL